MSRPRNDLIRPASPRRGPHRGLNACGAGLAAVRAHVSGRCDGRRIASRPKDTDNGHDCMASTHQRPTWQATPAGSTSANVTEVTSTWNGTVRILSLIHISEPTRRTPISYAVFCLK